MHDFVGEQTQEHCPACGGRETVALRPPSDRQSIISDGRILPRPIDKLGCPDCGLVRHRRQLGASKVAAIYSQDYGLATHGERSDDARGEVYSSLVIEALKGAHGIRRLLDVGCGSGALARHLRKKLPECQVWGVDPALPHGAAGREDGVTLARGLLGDCQGSEWNGFDAVVSINTIEHAVDPVGFIGELADRLRENARAVISCPAATPANCELLFYDHLWTLSPSAFAAFAARAHCKVENRIDLAGSLAGFQAFTIVAGAAAAGLTWGGFDLDPAQRYLTAWHTLDDAWTTALDAWKGPVQIFGAGQMAALLRAYAPRSWARADRLVVDDPGDAWNLGLPTARYVPTDHERGYITIVGVAPKSRDVVADRIRNDGGQPLLLPSTIQF
ncbi:class I SAM-dependent methyltransferase [Bosea sp. NPDC003192]|uniref:class I SAM-dependent methyltransferase n=1 Tax=Bosea sp. NPDC003192 TaxID=3390551 RepID=UPI003CFDA79D